MKISYHLYENIKSKNSEFPFWKLFNYGVDWQDRLLRSRGVNINPFAIRMATEKEINFYNSSCRMEAFTYPNLEELMRDDILSGVSEERVKKIKDLFIKNHKWFYEFNKTRRGWNQ